MMPLYQNYHIAVPTAFYLDETLNTEQTLEHITHLYQKGIRAVLVCGSTGEQHTLSLNEKLTLLTAIENASLPQDLEIIFGLACIRLKEANQLAEQLNNSLRVKAVLIGFPPYLLPSQKEAIAYASSIIERLGNKNIILYNNPKRTGFDLLTDSFIVLAKNPNVTGIKEAGAIDKATVILKQITRPIDIYCGGETQLKEKLNAGFNRLSSIAGNIYPLEIGEYFNQLCIHQETAQQEEKIQQLLATVYTESTIQTIKQLIIQQTHINMGICRSPLGMV